MDATSKRSRQGADHSSRKRRRRAGRLDEMIQVTPFGRPRSPQSALLYFRRIAAGFVMSCAPSGRVKTSS